MSDSTRPDLAGLTATLASNNARINKFVDRMPERVDRLVEAAAEQEWSEVRRMSDYLARSSQNHGYDDVAAGARRVCEEMDKPDNEVGIKRGLVRLIGICGRMRAQAEGPHSSATAR